MLNIDTSVACLENFVPESPWNELSSVPPTCSGRHRFAGSATLATAFAASLLAAGCQAPPAVEAAPGIFETTTLRIELATPNDAGKQMKVAVVQSPDGWLKSTGWAAARSVPVTPPLTIVEFEDLPARPTAISVFIDVDEDDNLARGAFGIPSEPYGFSNNVTVLFGPPRFGDATIELLPPLTITSIRIRNLSSRSDDSAAGSGRGRETMPDGIQVGVGR